MLSKINISNCYNLATTIDASRCPCLEIFKAFGTKITGVNFSNGGRLKIVRLPEIIAVYKEITESEYEQLLKQISVQKQQEMEELKQEVGNLKQMLAQQNILIQQLISRLN